MKPVRALAAWLLVALAGCAQDDPRCAKLDGGNYCLQPTAHVAPFEIQQKVDMHVRGQTHTLIAELEVDAAALRFIGLSPFGQKLVDITYDNHLAKASTLPNPQLSPTLLVALLQLALWPTEAVRTGLEAPLVLEERIGERRILNGQAPVVTIAYENGVLPHQRIHMTLHAAELQLSIEPLPPVSDSGNSK